MSWRRLLLPVVALAVAAAPAVAAELDVDRAIALALDNNAGFRSVEELRTQVAGGIRAAKADAFTQLTLISSWGQSRNPAFLNSPDFGELLDQFPEGAFEPSTQELYRSVVEVSQPVFTFGKIGAAVELAKIVADTAEAQISTARLDLAAEWRPSERWTVMLALLNALDRQHWAFARVRGVLADDPQLDFHSEPGRALLVGIAWKR